LLIPELQGYDSSWQLVLASLEEGKISMRDLDFRTVFLSGETAGYGLATANILYHLPETPKLLQSFVWQFYDIAPDYPRLLKFLTSGKAEIDWAITPWKWRTSSLSPPTDPSTPDSKASCTSDGSRPKLVSLRSIAQGSGPKDRRLLDFAAAYADSRSMRSSIVESWRRSGATAPIARAAGTTVTAATRLSLGGQSWPVRTCRRCH
jgi:uncharacterized protein Usg